MAHNSASKIFFFFSRKILFSFQRSRSLFFQQIAAPAFPWSSLDASVYITRLFRHFLTSSNACFLYFITISPWNHSSGFIFSICFTPSAGLIRPIAYICFQFSGYKNHNAKDIYASSWSSRLYIRVFAYPIIKIIKQRQLC